MKRISMILLTSCAALPLAVIASPALAQAQKPETGAVVPTKDRPTSDELADIIVTATRSGETNLQDTPIAVTAFSPIALKERGVTTALDLNGAAPNVSIGGRTGAGATSGAVTIRGIGVDANAPAQPAVGIYVDDVYIPSTFGNLLGTYDLAQVEILRGPQGTLFGRNTLGGALQYTGVKPKIGELSAFVEATAGNQKHIDVAAGLNVTLASWAALRISGASTYRDGFVRDLLNNVNRGTEKNSDARIQLRLQPTSSLLIDLKAEQVTQRSNGPSSTQTGFDYTAIFGRPFAATRGLDRFISPDFYTTFGPNAPQLFRSKIKLIQGVITYDINDEIKVKSVTAYSDTQDLLNVDVDGTPQPIFFSSRGDNSDKLFTQELQLAGNSFSDRLHWALGLYYYDEKFVNINTCSIALASPVCVNGTFGDRYVNTNSYAAYGQATFDITDRLSVVGGLRYTKDKVDVADPQAVYKPQNTTFNNTAPLVGVNFHVADDILLYGKWSRGFRAGSYSPNLFAVNAFGPETAETFEAGTRMEFLGRRVRINPTIFFTNQKNIQFNASALYLPPVSPAPTNAPVVQNAGNARSKGAEVETVFKVTQRLSVNANGALFEGHYTSLLLTRAGTPVANVTLNTQLKRAPKSSFAVGARYEIPVGPGNVALSANYAWQADQRSATSNNDNVPIRAYGILRARLTYTAPNNLYTVSLWSNNLANQKYIISGTTYGKGGLIPTTEVIVGRPREFGITLRANLK